MIQEAAEWSSVYCCVEDCSNGCAGEGISLIVIVACRLMYDALNSCRRGYNSFHFERRLT
eukprot:scaffold4963_cov115-Skeletonema_dohrnii-CCMP3373.AAC.7